MSIVYSYTQLIKPSTMEYPKYFIDVRKEFTNTSFPAEPQEEVLEPFGYFVIHEVTQPQGDVVTYGVPAEGEDGKWYQTWIVTPFTPEQIAENLMYAKLNAQAQANDVINTDMEIGFSYSLDEETFQISIRYTDISFMRSVIKTIVDDGSDEALYPFKFASGYKPDFTRQQLVDIVNLSAQTQYELMKKYWAYFNDVELSLTKEDIPPCPETFL